MVELFKDFGADQAAIADTFADFQAALGEPLNGNDPGPIDDGRRQINWDGAAVPFEMPNDFFNNAPLTRGVVFESEAGSQFRVSNPNNEPDSAEDNRFDSINPSYDEQFTTFSPNRLFTPIDTNVFDINFFVPGTDTPATVSGYGAVFTDVDLAGETTIEYYDRKGNLLLAEDVDAQSEGLSFLGATFEDENLFRVRVTLGNTPLGPDDNPLEGIDVVVMDDFLFGEPEAIEATVIDQGDTILFSDSGINAAAIDATFKAFQAALGDPLNGNTSGRLAEGRRQINWDGAAVPFDMPNNFFNNAPLTRGAVFTTDVGSEFRVSNPNNEPDSAEDNRFSSLNPDNPNQFTTFSPNRLFTPIDTNVFDINFFVPGTKRPATVSGYGAVFTDVDLEGETKIQYYDSNDNLLASETVEAQPEGLSFLGATFEDENLFRVRVTLGNTPIGATDNPEAGVDVVVMDDFLFGEPQAAERNVIRRGQRRRVKGTAGPDRIIGSRRKDTLIGGGSSDVLVGRNGDDKLIGVDPSDRTPGLLEIDTLRGGGGRDTFWLGNKRRVFYDDGNADTAGLDDYAEIRVLRRQDRIQLNGERSDYRIAGIEINGQQGTGIFLTEGQNTDELIGFAKGVSRGLVNSTLTFV